jgi:hypothetical protein
MAVGKIAGRRLTPLESLRFVPGRLSRAVQEGSRGFSLPAEAKLRFDISLAITAFPPRATCGLQLMRSGFVPRPHGNLKVERQNLRQG